MTKNGGRSHWTLHFVRWVCDFIILSRLVFVEMTKKYYEFDKEILDRIYFVDSTKKIGGCFVCCWNDLALPGFELRPSVSCHSVLSTTPQGRSSGTLIRLLFQLRSHLSVWMRRGPGAGANWAGANQGPDPWWKKSYFFFKKKNKFFRLFFSFVSKHSNSFSPL